MAKRLLNLIALAALLIACHTYTGDVTQTPTMPPGETALQIPVQGPSETPAPIVPTPGATSTLTATPTFKTPTAISGNPTSPSIIEATALGQRAITGWYTPNGNLNVRVCANIKCAITYVWTAHLRKRIYDMYVEKGTGDTWLTPDEGEKNWVAYFIGNTFFGTWEPDP